MPADGRGTAARPASRLRAWAELLRVSALVTVPGDALAGAAATGERPTRSTGFAMGASLCLYAAGMALNDWADQNEDATCRPHRPIPSGRIRPGTALAASAGLTAAGLALARQAGREAARTAAVLAATAWAYDLGLKRTKAGPAVMTAARCLDLLLGAVATSRSGTRAALGPAAALGAHTFAVTMVSRHEALGGSRTAPLAALGTTAVVGIVTSRRRGLGRRRSRSPEGLTHAGLAAGFAAGFAGPLIRAVLDPSPALTRRAVGGGIRAMIPLQAALAARDGSVGAAAAIITLAPAARRLSRRVSPT
ncbi:SCO3242 family prenyltransferase [Streptomyces sp. NPDC012756]|uniref:SCO3242 family prenyltransferase n=1 Tax=Streptomyces sp. NPDC012756 TaxID=3364847 RepID=UPI0036BCBA15